MGSWIVTLITSKLPNLPFFSARVIVDLRKLLMQLETTSRDGSAVKKVAEVASRSILAAGIMIAVLSVVVLPARAQPIPFGMHFIPVYNYIQNIEDFPDYRFISASLSFLSDEMSAHAIAFVTEDGLIRTVYPRFRTNSLYAVPKAAINISDARILEMNGTEFSDFLESSGAKMVTSLSHFRFAPDLSTEISVTKYYHIDFELDARLMRTVVTHGLRDIHIVLIVLPTVGLAGILAILAKRRRK